jgi:peptidoglycan/LPS O-acetylase OafA/YrhL
VALPIDNRSRVLRADGGARDWLNFSKGVAIIMVALFHVWLFYGWLGLTSVPRLKVILELFPIAAFFLIAGLFSGRQASWSFAELWRRRLLPYLYLYILWSVIRFAFAWVLPVVRGDGGVSARDPLTLPALLIWPSSSYWFIYALALATLMAWLARGVNPYLHLAVAAVVSALFLSGIVNLHNTGWNGLGEKYFFFIAGMFFARQIHAATARIRPWHVLALAVALGGIGLILIFFRDPVVLLLAFPATIIALAFGIGASVYLVRLRPLSFISSLGAKSFPLYILHLFVVTLATVLIRPISDLPVLHRFGTPLVLVVTALVLVASVYLSRIAVRIPWLFIPPFAAISRWRRARVSLPRDRSEVV